MPVSKPSPRRRAARKRAPSPPTRTRSSRPWRKRIGWPRGNIGARTGIVFLPFDQHHIFEQFGGAIVAVVGLMWATSR